MKIEIPKNLTIEQLAEMLRDAHPIATANMFPLGIFWIVLIALIAVFLSYRILFPKGKNFAIKMLAIIELKKIENMIKSEQSNKDAILKMSNLLRRIGVVIFGYETVANLYSNSWISFLLEHDKSRKLTLESAQALANAPYLSDDSFTSIDTKALYKQTYDWALSQKW